MNVFITLRIAFRALAKNKMRAGLTVLGVVIGIAAVTVMVSIGQSANQLVLGELQNFGTNVIMVFPARMQSHGVSQGSIPHLTGADAEALETECPAIAATSPMIFTGGQVIYGNTNWQPKQIFGVGANYLTVRNWPIHQGGFFTAQDISSSAKVCVIGHTLVEKLFQTTNPIGETIRIKRIPFRVVGVLETKGANMVGEDQDDVLLAPFTTVQKRMEGSSFADVHMVMVSAASDQRMNEAEEEIKRLLTERHRLKPGQPHDFHIENTNEIARVVGIVTGTMTLMERTREIGIRMAVGARGRDILRQFLVESVLLSCIGGAIGFGLGVSSSFGITKLINFLSGGSPWPVVISIPAAIAAFFFSGGVGIFFGFYPARKASKLDPIEALRYE